MRINIDKQKIEELLTRGVENIYPNRNFLEARLKSGKQLTLYLGIDPTGPTLHLGHAISLMKLRQFQELGHKVIMLIGSFTAMIGDPSDKMATRKVLTRKEVLANCQKYKEQAGSLLNFSGANKAEIKFNHKWLDKLSFKEVVDLASNFTVQQMLERDMFEKRLEQGKPVGLHEFLYPLMQGYDTIAMDVDGEIGGNDQTFNMLAGRTLMKALKNKEKFVLTNKLLTDSTGKKMGKSEGNMLALSDTVQEMFGKVMSWTDEMIVNGFELCTKVSLREIETVKTSLAQGENPRNLKMRLAREVAAMFYGLEEAQKAEGDFINTFQKGGKPEEMLELDLAGKTILEVLVASGLVASKSEAKRNLEQGGVKINDQVVKDFERLVAAGEVVQKGKRFFVKIK